MYRPSLKSGTSLLLLFVLSVVLFVIAQTNYRQIKAQYYDEKIQAAKLMDSYVQTLRTDMQKQGYQFDPIDDPFGTGLIGDKLSAITTSRGLLTEKQTSVNPNLAAVFVQELKKAKLKPGDYVAVGITGSNPGANLALYAAIAVLQLKPVVITALSSSEFGANRENMTWLDMEALLKKHNLLSFSTAYATYGGRDDLATGISAAGVQYLKDAMTRNNVPLIAGADLKENIDLHMQAYQAALPQGKRYHLFVNLGGALANVGSNVNARLVPEGMNRKLAEKEFVEPGVMMLFAKKSVPVLHVLRIIRLAKDNDLPIAPDKMPRLGEGKVFSSRIHNLLIVSLCLFLLLAAIIAVIYFDRYDRHFMQNIVDPDEEL